MNTYYKNRLSVRAYTADHIDDSLLHDILEAAAQAPNTGNMQLYSVVITRTEAGKEALAPAHFNQPAVTSCDALLTVCLDVNRFNRWCEASNALPGMDNFQAFTYSLIDAVIFAQQIVTIAEQEGLGTCYMGTTTYNAPSIAEALGLPKGVVPVATITMGYPAQEGSVSDRLPIEAIMHHERYCDYSPDDIARYYGPKESNPDNQRFVAENGKQSLAQVFTDCRYTRKDNEHFSHVLYDFLQSAGFPFPRD